MTIYEACVVLNIWPIVKVWAEVWSVSKDINKESLNNIKILAKDKFKQLAMIHHPDHGGDSNEYIKIKTSIDIIKNSTINDFISALDIEIENNKIYYKVGSIECNQCTKWSNIFNSCITTMCSGFKEQKTLKKIEFNNNAFCTT